MRIVKVWDLLFVLVAIMRPSFVLCLFERENRRVDLKSNEVYKLKSSSYRRNSSTRVAFVGQQGDRLSLICNIEYSQRNHQCSDDYFYVGYDLHPAIRGAEYYCGHRAIKKNSRPTTGRPILVVATSSTRYGTYGDHKCYIISMKSSNGPATSATVAPSASVATPTAAAPAASMAPTFPTQSAGPSTQSAGSSTQSTGSSTQSAGSSALSAASSFFGGK